MPEWPRHQDAIIEAKLAQQMAHLEQKPFFCIFLDLKKVFDAMDWDRCLIVLKGYGAGPNMIWLICHFWDKAQMVCRASGNYGVPFNASPGMIQGSPDWFSSCVVQLCTGPAPKS